VLEQSDCASRIPVVSINLPACNVDLKNGWKVEEAVMRAIRGCAVAVVMVALGSAAQASDASKNLAPDFSSLPEHSKIVVAPLDIELFEISTGGIPEPRADWTDSARKLMRAELEQRRPGLGVETVELDEATADELGELLNLHAAIAQSIALHHFGGVPLPTKNGRLDWSFGDAFKPLEERTGARYGLFVWVRDGYSSAGRYAAIVVAAILGVGLPHGQQSAYASLVDLDSGRVLWFNRVLRSHGDLREASTAGETVSELLKNFPVAR
jgi:hypothetical protein